MTEKKSNKGCIIAVVVIAVGFFGLAFIVLFAAIAIPAFVKYKEKAESSQISKSRKTAKVSKTRKMPKMTKKNESARMINKIALLVRDYYQKQCKFPANASSSALPVRGRKVNPDFSKGGWKDIKMPLYTDKLYFRYRLVNQNKKVMIVADADFESSKKTAYTESIALIRRGKCDFITTPPFKTGKIL